MKKWVVLIILIVIIGLSVYLRFWNLEKNPLWHGDECVYLAVARNLMHGRLQFEALNWTFFSAYLPQPPLFFLFGALSLLFIKSGIVALRVMVALSGVGTTVLLYFLGKEIRDQRTGVWASLLFSIYPLAVVYTRLAVPYTLGMFWITLTIYFCIKYLNAKSYKYLYSAGITTAFALFTIYYTFELALFLLVFMVFIKVDWKRIVTIMSIAVMPLVLLLVVMLLIDANSVLFDLRSLLWRSSQEIIPKHNIWSILAGYKKLWLLDTFMFFGIFGLFFIKREYRPYLWLGFFCISLLPIARQGIFLDIFFYPVVICLPFIFLGLASLIVFILDKLKIGIELGLSKSPPLSKGTQSFIYLVPILILLINLIPILAKDVRGINSILMTKKNYIEDTIKIAEYLNTHTKPNDMVIAPSSVYQFLHCHYASFYQAVAYTGKSIEFYPAHIPQSRFSYPCSYYWAKYLVIAEIDRIDTLTKPAVKEVWEKIQQDKWQMVYQLGEYDVYLNPLYKS